MPTPRLHYLFASYTPVVPTLAVHAVGTNIPLAAPTPNARALGDLLTSLLAPRRALVSTPISEGATLSALCVIQGRATHTGLHQALIRFRQRNMDSAPDLCFLSPYLQP